MEARGWLGKSIIEREIQKARTTTPIFPATIMSSFSTPPSSDTRTNRWKKRKPTPSNLSSNTSKRHRPDEEDDEEDEDEEPVVEEEDEEDELDASPAADPNSSSAALESEVISDGGIRISDFPPVIKHTVNRPHSSVLALVLADRAESRPVGATNPNPMFLENISHGQLQALSSIPANSPSLAPDHDRSDGSSSAAAAAAAAAYVCSPPAIMEGKGITRHYGNQLLHVMPMHSDWFSPSSVNRLERQVVPHFFSGKLAEHTPEKYMELRNRIVAKYMENQEKRLSVVECQGLVKGVSENDLMRVVRFLDHWGIINYMAPAQNRHKTGGPVLREDVNGEVHIPAAFLKSSIDSLIGFDKPKCRLRPEDVATLCSSVGILDLDSRIRERLAENHCNCCARPLPNMYYQSQKEADIMLCSDCFHDGNFVAGNSSIDFLRVDSTKDFCDLDGDSWTDQETLLLLEALEFYSDNWNDIAEHVGTKSKAQCILHFIRLPTEDGLLENIELPHTALSSDVLKEGGDRNTYANLNGDSDGACLQDNDIDNRIPFVNSGNPVMALVAFLASAVGPRVAAACAHAALAALSKEDHHSEVANGIIQAEGSSHADRSSSENMHREGGSLGAITNLSHQTENTGAASLSPESVKAAAKSALSAAATKAKLFADHEEREIQRLTAAIITHQLKRLELKLKQFAEVETLLMKECEQVERTRQRLAAERARMISTRLGPAGATAQPGATTANSSNSIGSNVNQPVMPASAAQANLSSYSNNQPTHPHMPFMPRQQMFSFGPRLPLSVINPSSSAPSPTTMYPSAPSNTATFNHPTLRPVSGSKIQM